MCYAQDKLETAATAEGEPPGQQGGHRMRPAEIIFEVTEAAEGGYDARALGHSIFTQGDDWDDLKAMARDAVLYHFDEDEAPGAVRLHLVRDEAIAV